MDTTSFGFFLHEFSKRIDESINDEISDRTNFPLFFTKIEEYVFPSISKEKRTNKG
jgi:hypothetical protein